VDRRNSGEQIAAAVRASIFDGELRAGDRIRQDDLAATHGVSRIPVREAMIALDREGWVTIEPHRGAFVNGFGEASVRDHYELLGMTYGLAARRAAERGSGDAKAELSVRRKALIAAGDVEEFSERNEAYFRQVFRMAESPRFIQVLQVLAAIVPGNFFERVPGTEAVQRRSIGGINKAIVTGDADRAVELSNLLMRRHGDLVVKALRQHHALAD